MKIRHYTFLFLLNFALSCSNNEEVVDEAPLETGNLEVSVVFDNDTPVSNAIVSTVPSSSQMMTNSNGVVTFEDIPVRDYTIEVLIPGNDIPFTESATIIANGTARISITTGGAPIMEVPLNIDAALNTAYNNLTGPNIFDANGYSGSWGDIGTDILYTTSNTGSNLESLDSYNFETSNSKINAVWADHYNAIRITNIGLDAIADANFDSPTGITADSAVAEFRFLRALLYFNLVKLYGNPIVVTTAKIDVDNPSPFVQGADETYQLIVEDLIFAESNLTSSNPSNRASIGAAQALLGKVYLQMAGFPMQQTDNYSRALEQFNKVLGQYSLESNYPSVFSLENEETNTEVIFRVDFDVSNNQGGNYGVFWGPLGIAQNDNLILTPGFPESFFPDPSAVISPVMFPLNVADTRFDQNIATFAFQSNTSEDQESIANWRPYKFRKDLALSVNENNESFDFIYLRYADILLSLAETENAMNGPTAVAYDAINQVRRRAYGSPTNDLSPGLSQGEFLEAILHERRLELCYEGQRKDDLVRTQYLEIVINQFNADNPSVQKNYQPHKQVWPIPQSEINLNPNVVQNPGY